MSVLAFDLGASSGRAVVGEMKNQKLIVHEIHRFSNDPVQVGKHLHWDILRLFYEIKQGIVKANQGFKLNSMAIDSWAVDFGLLDKNGELLRNPYHYRDHQTDGIMEEVFSKIKKEEIFNRTGIQFLPFNTIYQLYAIKKQNSDLLDQTDTLLLIPDLLRYFLTGKKIYEFSNITTTQLFDPIDMKWDSYLIERLGLPSHIFLEDVVTPGAIIGRLSVEISKELNVPQIQVIAIGEHDTASAVAAVPADTSDFAYLSCGTWSLMGTEVPAPVINEQALQSNFTNEGGVEGTFRLLKNIMGLWLVQECKRIWSIEGKDFSFAELINEAEKVSGFQSFIEPDDVRFLNPVNMPIEIQNYCKETNQKVPETIGEIIRCIMESLAFKYRYVFEETARVACKQFNGLNMVGGGIQNELLCQLTSNALGKPVWAGPVEASAIGNISMQLIGIGIIKNIKEARNIIKQSFPIKTYHPVDQNYWYTNYTRFCDVVQLE